jgi:hypothetical protein
LKCFFIDGGGFVLSVNSVIGGFGLGEPAIFGGGFVPMEPYSMREGVRPRRDTRAPGHGIVGLIVTKTIAAMLCPTRY